MSLEPATRSSLDARGLRIAVITALFNESITEGLRSGAVECLEEAGAEQVHCIEAPGAFELPLLAATAIDAGFDGVVALGAVIQGETDHYEHVAHRASEGLLRVSLDTGVPVGFGVLTTATVDHALTRSRPGPQNKGRECAAAVIATLQAQTTIRKAATPR